MTENNKIISDIIDRSFGLFYGIGQLMPLPSLWDDKFNLPMQCLRFCLKNAYDSINDPENCNQDSVLDHIRNHITSLLNPIDTADKQWMDTQFAFAFYTLLLCRLTASDVESFFDWSSIIDTVLLEVSSCVDYDEGMFHRFKDEIKKESDSNSANITRKGKNPSPLTCLKESIKLINISWPLKYGRFGMQYVENKLGLDNYGSQPLLEPTLYIVMLGSIAGALIGRHSITCRYNGCERMGPEELNIAVRIGDMMATPGIVPEMNEGFFTRILIVSDNPDDETCGMAKYLALKYPNASIHTLHCMDAPVALLEKLSEETAAKSIDLVIGMRGVASVVCQMRGLAKILIFPEFHDIWPAEDTTFNEESIFGGMTSREQGLVYGVLANRSKDDVDSRLYWKYYRSGERGYESGFVTTRIIDNLNSTIWNLCTPTVLPEYEP